jgi:hypothetical protein
MLVIGIEENTPVQSSLIFIPQEIPRKSLLLIQNDS